MENVMHTRDEIFNKDFKNGMRGYDRADVDSFLDEIMSDYMAYDSNIQELQNKIKVLQDQVDEYKKQLSSTSVASAKSAAPMTNTNMDILKRLSNLERRVFGTSTETPTVVAMEKDASSVE
ncbi:cell division regulator GpsB [Weissella soli]|uniref:cell division regulator GpsB n=1 Tax=Weissella soli TaxID=155866 RepID=UPI00359F6BF8